MIELFSSKHFLAIFSLFLLFLVGSYGNVEGQGYLQFQENNGQWNSEVLYRAELPNGHIYLRKGGLTYDFLKETDVQALVKRMHGTHEAGDDDTSHFIVGPGHPSNRKKNADYNQAQPVDKGLDPIPIHGHAYQVNFLGANENPVIKEEKKGMGHYNYLIGNDRSKWGRNVQAYGSITYENLYPQVNAHFYSSSDGLKYDLIVQPGGNIKQIKFEYKGVDHIFLRKGHLHIETSVGETIEVAPYAYQIVDNQRVEVKCAYQLKNNVLNFKVGSEYRREAPLIIDPSFIFATFSGSDIDNWGYTATYDAAGNFYMGGIVFGTGYPATPGAYQTSYGGGGQQSFDIGLSKFSPDGTELIYATYLGGNNDEQPHSLVVNSKSQLIVSGRTKSSDFPETIVTGTRGSWDMILTQLTGDGSNVINSMVIGGSKYDGVNIEEKYSTVSGQFTHSLRRFYGDDARSEVNVDADDNIILVGATQSTESDGFPITSGVFQPTFGGATPNNAVQQDAIVMKAAPDLSSITWLSYLGGSGNDAAYVLSFAQNGNIYVAGGTESKDFPGTSGTLQTQNNGKVDGFIAEITPDGSTLVRSTYLGTDQADQIYGIQTDTLGNVYVGGTTEGVWDDLFSNTIHFPDDVKYGKQFIVKMTPELDNVIYSATFGSNGSKSTSLPNISPTAFQVDRCQNVYVSGWGGNIVLSTNNGYGNQGTSNMPMVNSLNMATGDGKDFYFFVMEKDGAGILYADIYGQNGGFTDHVDGGTSRFDPQGVIYQGICANCGGGTTFPTGPPGVFSRQNGSLRGPGTQSSASCNMAGVKIAFNLDGVRGGAATLNRRPLFCNTEEVTFIDTIRGRPAESWTWDVFEEDTTTLIDGPFENPVDTFKYQFPTAGKYVVRMIKYNPGDCIDRDTSYVAVRIGDNPAELNVTTEKLPPCDQFQYRFVNSSSSLNIDPIPNDQFIWNFDDGTGDQVQASDTILHNFPEEGIYHVSLTLIDEDNYCNTPLDTTIIVSASFDLEAGLEVPDNFCAPGSYPLNNVSIGGTKFTFVINDSVNHISDTIIKNDLSPVMYDFDDPGAYEIKLFAEDEVCDLIDSTSKTVLVYPHPTAGFAATTDQPGQNPPVNAIFHFENQSLSNYEQVDDTLYYEWDFGDGATSTEKDPDHLYNKTGTYTVTLVVTNNAGCTDSISGTVTEEIVPALDVPSAFTPGTKDINSRVAPKAFAVEKMDFRIYNRWGQLVFESQDPDIAFDFSKGWDGTFNGKPQEMDAYAYVVNVVYTDGTTASKKGSITLIR